MIKDIKQSLRFGIYIYTKYTMPVELYYDEYLELSNILYLYNDKSHTSIINMIADIKSVIEQIHDYCVMNVYEDIDLNTLLPTLKFCEKDIQFIQEKMTHIDYILYSTLTIICKEFSKNYHIIRLINAIKEKSRDYDFRYYTSVAYEEWNNRNHDIHLYNTLYIKREEKVRELNKHGSRNKTKTSQNVLEGFDYIAPEEEKKLLESDYVRDTTEGKNKMKKSSSFVNLFDTSTWANWFDVGEPLVL